MVRVVCVSYQDNYSNVPWRGREKCDGRRVKVQIEEEGIGMEVKGKKGIRNGN